MSGPATHYMVGQLLMDSYVGNEATYGSQLRANSPCLNLGTMGPDFLFFNVKDWPGGDYLASPLNTFIQINETINELKEKIKIDLGPIIDTVEAAADRSATLDEMGDLYNQLQSVLTGLTGIIQNYAQSNITEPNLIFDLLTHPIQANHDECDWWWFDSMHYRKTGEFAKQMYLQSKSHPDSPQHAFAMGYLSHVASDLVGHPYVNTLVGGPYRLHPKRHKLVENYQDVWNFRHFRDKDFCYSNLYQEFELSDNELSSISRLIADATRKVYKHNVDEAYGNDLTEDDIKNAYKIWMKWFKNTTGQEPLPPPRDYELSGEIQQVWDTFVDNLDDFSDLIDDMNVTGNNVIDSLLAALLAAVLGPIVLALAVVDFLLGLTVTLGSAPVRYFMSFVYNSIYDAFYKYRYAVTLNGFAFPLRDDLDHLIVQHTYNPTTPDLHGRKADWGHFPKRPFSEHGNESHLIHPQSAVEKNKTTPSPKSYLVKTPDYYVNGSIPFDQNILQSLGNFDENTLDQLHTRMTNECMGNAVQLTKELATVASSTHGIEMPNLSLDADRGMGYRCWGVDGLINSQGVVEPKFTDR